MRLATYNIKHGESSDRRVDTARLRDAVASLDADVVCLQEVDRGQPRSHGADQAAEIADAVGAAAYRFAPALTGVLGESVRPSTATDLDGTGPGYGVALVSRWPVLSWHTYRLPLMPGPGIHRTGGWVVPPDEQRVVLVGVVSTPDGPVTVATTHLSLVPAWHSLQLWLALRRVGLPGPRLLTGDFNLRPVSVRPVAALAGRRSLARARTFPAQAPNRQIDHVLADRRIPVTGVEAPELPVSDHRPLVVDLRTVSP
ncbi:MAG TPA: endonuclease/exonuclease/phosphatase family protein [Mycobacteriales bacterium]|nr:endonuclease/exonuclease/phosphatase family protein [Mycobacteriales bacterium]